MRVPDQHAGLKTEFARRFPVHLAQLLPLPQLALIRSGKAEPHFQFASSHPKRTGGRIVDSVSPGPLPVRD